MEEGVGEQNWSLFQAGCLEKMAREPNKKGHKAALFPVFKGISTLFSIVAVLGCIPTKSVRGFPFLHTLLYAKTNTIL